MDNEVQRLESQIQTYQLQIVNQNNVHINTQWHLSETARMYINLKADRLLLKDELASTKVRH
jgi:hypothetical protein